MALYLLAKPVDRLLARLEGELTCKPCARRRKALAAKKKQKQAEGKPVQAAALGAVLAVSEAAGKVMGIHGEVEDGRVLEEGIQEREPEHG